MIGERVVDALLRTESAVVHYRGSALVIAEPRDAVILTELPLEDALRVLATLGKSDEELEAFIERYEALSTERRSVEASLAKTSESP